MRPATGAQVAGGEHEFAPTFSASCGVPLRSRAIHSEPPIDFGRWPLRLSKDWRLLMKHALVAASALAILAGAQSFAQTVGVGPGKTVVIEPEQRTVIRDYVVKERVAPVTVKERLSVGATLPADVELRTVP